MFIANPRWKMAKLHRSGMFMLGWLTHAAKKQCEENAKACRKNLEQQKKDFEQM